MFICIFVYTKDSSSTRPAKSSQPRPYWQGKRKYDGARKSNNKQSENYQSPLRFRRKQEGNIIRQRLKDIELQRWLSEINNDTRKDANQRDKMRTYRLFKTIDNYRCEDYLHQVTNTRHRIALTKLRLSNHKIAIETGRYSRPFKKPAERICPICKIEMEDEYHFLNICPAYQEKRCSLLDYKRIKISRMSPNKIFLFLKNPPSGNVQIQNMIVKHIFECFEKRKGEDGKATLRLN